MIKFCPNCGKEVASKFCPYCGCEVGKFTIADFTEKPIETTTETAAEKIPVISVSPEQEKAEEEIPVISLDPVSTTDAHASENHASGNQTADTHTSQQSNVDYKTYYIPPESQKEPVTKRTWFIILFLIIFWPLGLFFMWRAKKFSKAARIVITVIIGILFVLNIISTIALFNASSLYDGLYDYDNDYDYSYDYDSDDVWNDSSDSDYDSSSGTIIDGRTASEAVQSYLNALYFSRQGLIEQLEYEGYSNSEATKAVDAYGVDWNQQAAGSARDYLNTFPDLTRSEMIEQLEYEGYTYSQAAYGADSVGL